MRNLTWSRRVTPKGAYSPRATDVLRSQAITEAGSTPGGRKRRGYSTRTRPVAGENRHVRAKARTRRGIVLLDNFADSKPAREMRPFASMVRSSTKLAIRVGLVARSWSYRDRR